MYKLFLHTEKCFKRKEDVSKQHVCSIHLVKKISFYVFHIRHTFEKI